MNIEEILDEWKQDSKMNHSKLNHEALNVPSLHHKYIRMMVPEKLKVRKLKSELKKLEQLKIEYFNGKISEEELNELGWEPFYKTVLRQDMSIYLDADQDIINMKLKIAYSEEKIDLLDSIIRTIINRGFLIKNIIDWEKFQAGY